jgi:hypothetical protein
VFTLDIPYEKEVPVSLSLPAQVVCNDAAQLQFTVQPTDGVVASTDEPASVVKVNNSWFFDPTKVGTLNKVITFTVNGKPTGCQVTVLQHPKPAFQATAKLVTGASGVMAVTFKNLTDPANNQGLNYHWDFSDKTSKDTNSTADFTQQFNFNILKSQGQTALTVLLAASNAACDDKTLPQSVPFPQETQIPATCQDTVKVNVATDFANIQAPSIKSYLASIPNNPQFTAIRSQWETTVNILKDANAQVANFNQPAVQQSTLTAALTQLGAIYASKFDKQTNEIVVTPEVQVLVKLALNIVKCETTLTGVVIELLQRIIKEFLERLSTLKAMIPSFNKDSAMNKFIEAWLSDTKLTDAALIKLIKELNDKIKSTFAP